MVVTATKPRVVPKTATPDQITKINRVNIDSAWGLILLLQERNEENCQAIATINEQIVDIQETNRWHTSKMPDVTGRNPDHDARYMKKSGGLFLGPVGFFDGTAAAPAAAFLLNAADDWDTGFYCDAANRLSVTTNGTERFRWHADGDVTMAGDFAVGVPTGYNPDGQFQVAESNTNLTAYFDTYDDGTQYTRLYLRKSDTDTIGTAAETDANDYLGELTWHGVNNANTFNYGATIRVRQDGASVINVPCYMGLFTASAASYNERMRIHSTGDISIPGDVIIGAAVGTNPVSHLEVWSNTEHPIISITGDNNTLYDPQIQFRTDTPDTIKWSLGVDAGVSDRFRLGSVAEVATADRYIDIEAEGLYALGKNAGDNSTGIGPLFIGYEAGGTGGAGNTGQYNTAIGYQAGYDLTSGDRNFLCGYQCGFNVSTGSDNLALGVQSLYTRTTSNFGIGIGYRAFYTSNGTNNYGIGYRAGYLSADGTNNIAIGFDAMYNNPSGDYNIVMGYEAALGSVGNSFDNCVIIGRQAAYTLSTGSQVVAIGYTAARNNTTGIGNTCVGYSSGFTCNTGDYNVNLGYFAGYYQQAGDYNICIGYRAGYSFNAASTYSNNIFVGRDAAYRITTGADNVVMGRNAGNYISTPSDNVLIGQGAAQYVTTGTHNVCVGSETLRRNYTGGNNVIIGYQAGHGSIFNQTVSNCTLVGVQSGYNITSAITDTALGYLSLFNLTSGDSNTAIGAESGYTQTTASRNVFLGYTAGYYETGSNKFFVDNRTRTNEATSRISSMMYGLFDASVYVQWLRVNGSLGINANPGCPLDVNQNQGDTIARAYNRGVNGGMLYSQDPGTLTVSSKSNGVTSPNHTPHYIFSVGRDNSSTDTFNIDQYHFIVEAYGAHGKIMVETTTTPDERMVIYNTDLAYACLLLHQDNVDEPFYAIDGRSAASKNDNISSLGSGGDSSVAAVAGPLAASWTHQGMYRIQMYDEGGDLGDYWVPVYN